MQTLIDAVQSGSASRDSPESHQRNRTVQVKIMVYTVRSKAICVSTFTRVFIGFLRGNVDGGVLFWADRD